MKSLILESIHKGQLAGVPKDQEFLLFAVPFVCNVLRAVADSKVFAPPNSWTMGLLGLLVEIHNIPDIKVCDCVLSSCQIILLYIVHVRSKLSLLLLLLQFIACAFLSAIFPQRISLNQIIFYSAIPEIRDRAASQGFEHGHVRCQGQEHSSV